MKNLKETDRKDLIMKRKRIYIWRQEIIGKRNLVEWQKKQLSPEKYRYLEWTGRCDNGKKCTTTQGKNWANIDMETESHKCNSGPVY